MKQRIKARWTKLSDNEIDGLGGRLSPLARVLQRAYGYGRARAKRELTEFERSLETPDRGEIGPPPQAP